MARSLDELPRVEWPDASGRDSYEIIREVRKTTPFVRGPFMGLVLGLRYAQLETVMGEKTRQLETETKLLQGITSGPIFDFVDWAMLTANGDAHRRRRAPIQRTFAFKLMDAMRPKAAALTEDLVRPHIGAGPVDFLSEIATQIPARIIADILGVPRSDLPVFLRWVGDTGTALGLVPADRRAEIEQSLTEFNVYVAGLLADRRARPRDDFLSEYVAATAEAGDLSDGEIRTQVIGLILAGSDTTRNSMCMILSRLLQHPEQWRALCGDPDGLKRGAVSEGLRYDSVISGVPRVVVTPFELDGYDFPAGALVSVSLLAAMRDPELYAEPDRFDIFRTDHPRWHPVFGAGAHRCAGEALARAELEEAVAAIARLAPKSALVGKPPELLPGGIRQVDAMQVAFR